MGFFSLIIRKMSLQTFGGPFTTCVRPSSIKACVVSLRFVSTIQGLLFIHVFVKRPDISIDVIQCSHHFLADLCVMCFITSFS